MAWARYLVDDLPPGANAAFAEAEREEARILLPDIALGEFLYLALRGRIRGENPEAVIKETLFLLQASKNLQVASLRMEEWELFLTISVAELHARMIAAVGLGRGAPVLTDDPEIQRVPGLRTIWK